MDKFYFEPSRGEMAAALRALFAPQLGAADVKVLLDAFPEQPMDFFGSIKARLVDGAVRRWLHQAGGAQVRCGALASGPSLLFWFGGALAAWADCWHAGAAFCASLPASPPLPAAGANLKLHTLCRG